MKRYPAYDPPEYLAFKASDAVLSEYNETISDNPLRKDVVDGLGRDALMGLYEGLLRFRPP